MSMDYGLFISMEAIAEVFNCKESWEKDARDSMDSEISLSETELGEKIYKVIYDLDLCEIVFLDERYCNLYISSFVEANRYYLKFNFEDLLVCDKEHNCYPTPLLTKLHGLNLLPVADLFWISEEIHCSEYLYRIFV